MLLFRLLCRFMPWMLTWNSDTHLSLTGNGLTDALGRLQADGSLKKVSVTRIKMAIMFSWLGLYNTAEDVEWCNVNDLVDEEIKKIRRQPASAQGPSEEVARALEKRFGKSHFAHSCAVGIGGDQISHFMQSEFAPGQMIAWNRSFQKIVENCSKSWAMFNETFPNRTGIVGTVEGLLLDAHNISIFDLVFGGVVADNIITPDKGNTTPTKVGVVGSWLADQARNAVNNAIAKVDPFQATSNKFREGQHWLGRALHTLQDSFSPAHTLRDKSGQSLVDIYMYDKDNKDPGPIGPSAPDPEHAASAPGEFGWPGHHAYDRSDNNFSLQNLARQATADVIYCVIANIHQSSSKFGGQLGQILLKWMPRHKLPVGKT